MELTTIQIWEKLSTQISQRISPDGYQRWFSDVSVLSLTKESITLSVPNPIHQFFIESNYSSLILASIEEIFGSSKKLLFATSKELQESEGEEPVTVVSKPSSSKRSSFNTPLNKNYTFETFISGANSQFAHAAALSVAQTPALTYNPLFIYGESGLGKTHLLHAIGQRVATLKKGAKIVYLRSEQFINEFIDAIQHSSLQQFRKRYRQADVLLIDDIQFFAGKERSQEEFFHTFGALHDHHKQIVLTSDRPPSEILQLEKRLVSRFEWGMTAEIQAPDLETRIAILQGKSEQLQASLDFSILEFLAESIPCDIRRLEGALMRVAAYQSLSGKKLCKDSVSHLLRDLLQQQPRKSISLEAIQELVSTHFDLPRAAILSKKRQQQIAYPRQLAMYLAREYTSSTFKEIGFSFGGKDHGTVIHAHKLIKKRLEKDSSLQHLVEYFDKQLVKISSL